MFAFMVTLIALSELTRVHRSTLLQSASAVREREKIEVRLTGAVISPGLYRCDPGISLGQLLKEAKLSTEADRRRIEFKKILYSSQGIEIPQKTGKVRKKNSK